MDPLPLNKEIKLYTIADKTGKYGRYLGIIVDINDDNDNNTEICLNQELLDNNMAKKY